MLMSQEEPGIIYVIPYI